MLIAFDTSRGAVVAGPETCPDWKNRSRNLCEQRYLLADGGVVTQNHNATKKTLGCTVPHNKTGGELSGEKDKQYKCIVCGKPVTRNIIQNQGTGNIEDVFGWFEHVDGGADCFGDGSMGYSHRAAVELSAHRLAHASQQITSNCADRNTTIPRIDPEKCVTAPTNNQWIKTDVHLDTPRVAVEVFSEISQLDLRRRLTVLFDAGYDAYLVFDTDGRYDPNEIEARLQSVATAPVRVGRFNKSRAGPGNPASLTIGTRLSDNVIEPSALTGPDVPVFLQ